jgi:hypothetical protein
MAEKLKPGTLRVLVWAGVADIVVGIGLTVAALMGLFGPGLDLLAVAGGFVALWGAGLIIWGRNKLSQVEDRRGDLN